MSPDALASIRAILANLSINVTDLGAEELSALDRPSFEPVLVNEGEFEIFGHRVIELGRHAGATAWSFLQSAYNSCIDVDEFPQAPLCFMADRRQHLAVDLRSVQARLQVAGTSESAWGQTNEVATGFLRTIVGTLVVAEDFRLLPGRAGTPRR